MTALKANSWQNAYFVMTTPLMVKCDRYLSLHPGNPCSSPLFRKGLGRVKARPVDLALGSSSTRARLGENLSYRSSVFARVVNAMNRAMDHLPSG
jgi:hypothetical protein